MRKKNPFNIPASWDSYPYNRDFYLSFDVRAEKEEIEKDERNAKYRILEILTDEELRKFIWEKRQELQRAEYWHDYIEQCIKTFQWELNRRLNEWRRRWREDLERKKQEVDILQVVESYVSILRYKPWNLIKCPMPNHEDGSASMMLYTKNNTFHCFWCHAGGSQIDFIQKMDNCSLADAIKKFLTY